MKILSLFDGISAGRLALDRAGIPVSYYGSSEIDPYAIKVSSANFKDITRLGDIRSWQSWELPPIELVMGGSPCQGLSLYSKERKDFDDPRSALFFLFVNVLSHVKPRYFLLENTPMNKESEVTISRYLGVEPVTINSSLLSAQNRKRLYWTNIPLKPIVDKNLVIKDILLDLEEPYPLKFVEDHKGGQCKKVDEADLRGNDNLRRVYSIYHKCPTLAAYSGGNLEPKVSSDLRTWRKLTPVECERLQTFPDGYTESVSKSRRYSLLGNSWTVDVIAHILGGINNNF